MAIQQFIFFGQATGCLNFTCLKSAKQVL